MFSGVSKHTRGLGVSFLGGRVVVELSCFGDGALALKRMMTSRGEESFSPDKQK